MSDGNWFSDWKGGFGYTNPDHGDGGEDLSVYQSSSSYEGFRTVDENENVEFQNEQSDDDGRSKAVVYGTGLYGNPIQGSGGYGGEISSVGYGYGGGYPGSSSVGYGGGYSGTSSFGYDGGYGGVYSANSSVGFGSGGFSYGESEHMARNRPQGRDDEDEVRTLRVKKASIPREPGGHGWYLGGTGGGTSEHYKMIREVYDDFLLDLARTALKFYKETNQDAEFRFVEGFFFESLELGHPDWEHPQEWFHVSFTAKKTKKAVFPTHFFAELKRDDRGNINPEQCCTFKPSAEPGFRHGCVICPPEQNFHPCDDKCIVGFKPYYEAADLVF